MSFCKFSSEIQSNNFTVIDNSFFEKHMRFATGEQVRVYLWGLYLCSQNNMLKSNFATLDNFAENLGLTTEEIMDIFTFWQEQGLVQIIETTPPEIQYLPIKNSIPKHKFKTDKYEQFNLQAQSILSERIITPNESSEYHSLMETFNMSPEALLMIMQYCAEYKSAKVGYSYILAVAKNWANEGITTLQQVEQKFKDFNEADVNIKKIMGALGSSRKPSLEERQQYIKWTKDYDFSNEVIIAVAKQIKKGGFDKLDNRLSKYYEMHLMSEREIEEYEKNKETLYSLAKDINKIIGVYYENLENIIESYINPWLTRGYNEDTLKIVANYCFKNSIRNLEGMDNVIQRFYKNGLTSVESIAQFVSKAKAQDEQIKQILGKANIIRNVTTWDRDFYKTWIYSWNMSQEVIEYAASLSADKTQPIQYINKILSNWFQQKISTLEQAKNTGDFFKNSSDNTSKVSTKKEITDAEVREMNAHRLNSEISAEKNYKLARKNSPEFLKLDNTLREKTMQYGQANPNNESTKKLQLEITKLKQSRLDALSKIGMTEKDITPQYHCSKCKDTGFIDGKMCECLKEKVKQKMSVDNSQEEKEKNSLPDNSLKDSLICNIDEIEI